MTTLTTGERPTMRRSALIGGLGLLSMAVIAGLANFGVLERLIIENDATATAREIRSAPELFQLGIWGLVAVVVLDVVVAWALWHFFNTTDHRMSTLAAWCRVLYAGVFGVAIWFLMSAARLLDSSAGLAESEAMADITRFQDIWAMGLGLFGLHLLLIGWLAVRSHEVPKWIGILVAVAGGGYVIDSVGGLLSGSTLEVGTFTFVGEVVLMVWLLLYAARSRSGLQPTVRV